MTQMPSLDFQCHVAWSDERGETLTPVDYFPNFIGEMLRFFAGGAPSLRARKRSPSWP